MNESSHVTTPVHPTANERCISAGPAGMKHHLSLIHSTIRVRTSCHVVIGLYDQYWLNSVWGKRFIYRSLSSQHGRRSMETSLKREQIEICLYLFSLILHADPSSFTVESHDIDTTQLILRIISTGERVFSFNFGVVTITILFAFTFNHSQT